MTWILFSATGLSPLLPFAILGAVMPDADIFFSVISDTHPSLYLFTHGGIAHSLTGALVLSLLVYGVIVIFAPAGIIPIPAIQGSGMYAFTAVLSGTCLHLAIDILACPGIPLLAPFADRKYTLGILPGPSILIAFAALEYVIVTVTLLLDYSGTMGIYAIIVILYLAVRGDFSCLPVSGYRGGKYRK